MNKEFEEMMNKNEVGIKILEVLLSYTTMFKLSGVWYSIRRSRESIIKYNEQMDVWNFETDYTEFDFCFGAEGLAYIKLSEFLKPTYDSFGVKIEKNKDHIESIEKLLKVSLVKKSLS